MKTTVLIPSLIFSLGLLSLSTASLKDGVASEEHAKQLVDSAIQVFIQLCHILTNNWKGLDEI